MTQNVGIQEAILRIGIGAFLLARASAKESWGMGDSLLAAFGAAQIAQGVTRTCVLNAALGITSVEDEGEKVVFKLGPITYRRLPRPRARTLWGVQPELGHDDIGYRAPTAAETSGWNWDGQPENS